VVAAAVVRWGKRYGTCGDYGEVCSVVVRMVRVRGDASVGECCAYANEAITAHSCLVWCAGFREGDRV